ncbi:hypothetical protein MLD38_005691 [Melastoma candidum]|uniref:Uncharacterized protein n=1 Tax=Melastoma candidum TaxID=119954 RepID=A0ACB9RPM5_9MYRT|nr:hypothetical protein MLD38_005691 [Melastoma candidum]
MEGMKASVFRDGKREREDEEEEEEEEDCSVDELASVDSNSGSSFSSELTQDASSSSSASSSFSGPLFEFSDLMANLPIKRGLSRYYDGKSQSFTCLGRATSLEDLIKKDYHSPHKKRMKPCKSYAADIGSDRHRAGRSFSPKATVTKKVIRISSFVQSPAGNGLGYAGRQ